MLFDVEDTNSDDGGVIKGTADDGCSLRHPLPARSMSTFVLNRCNDCRSTLKRRIVSSTGDAKPENYGRPFYACRRPNSFKLKGHCSYFRFADIGFESIEDWSFPTAASPPSSSTSSESFAMPLRSNRLRCVLDTCGKIANKHCDSKKCEPHCLADGGCSHKSHRLGTSKHGPTPTFQQSSAEPAPAQSSSHPTPSPPPSIPQHVQPNQDAGLPAPVTPSLARITPTTPAISPADTTRNAVAGPSRPRPAPNSATSLAPGTQGQPAPVTPTISPAAVAPNAVASSSRPRPTPKSVTPHDHPRHTSKATSGYMIDSLALMYGKQQEVRDEEAVREEQKKEQRKREKREVIVHCWHKDDKEPMHEVLESDGGLFWFTDEHLKTLGIVNLPTSSSELIRFKVYKADVGYWLGAGLGYSFKVTAGQHIFVAASTVQDTAKLDGAIARYSASRAIPHLRDNLSSERASIRSQRDSTLLAAAALLKTPSKSRQHSGFHSAFESSPLASPSFSAFESPLKPRQVASHPSLGPSPKPRRIAPHPSLGSLPLVPPSLGSPSLAPPSTLIAKLDTIFDTVVKTGKRKHTDYAEEDVIELSDDDKMAPGELLLPEDLRGTTISLLDSGSSSEDINKSERVKGKRPQSRRASSTGSSTSGTVSGSRSISNPRLQGSNRQWPADFWCEEIDEGFSIMNALRGNMKTSEAFFEGFPSASHFNKSTFSDNHERWLFAEPAAREVALRAGRTNAGRWTIFAATNPSKKSKLLTARRALAGKGGLMSLPVVDEESM